MACAKACRQSRTDHRSIQSAAVAARAHGRPANRGVVVSLGASLLSQNSTGVVAVASGDREIGEDDVQRVVSKRLAR